MSEISAHQDEQQNFSIIGVQGTLGTADTKGTATTIPIGVDPSTGAAYVYNLGPAGSVSLGNIVGGTINRIDTIGTLPAITMGDLTGGTIDVLTTGSIVVTQGTIASVGTIPGVGIIGNLNGGSIVVTNGTTTISGTVPISGTVTSTPGNSTGGTLDLVKTIGTVSNIAGGSIVVTAGTVVTTMGDLSGGTIDILTDGTLSKVGTIPGVGIIGNLNTGSIVVTNGTIASSGTVTGVGIVGNVNDGTVSVKNLGTDDFATGTATEIQSIIGLAIPGASTHTLWDGKTVGGTLDVLSAITTGTIANSGTTTGVGTVTGVGVIGALTTGSIVVTNGTLASSGTTTGVGVVGNLNGGSITIVGGTITTGTIQNVSTGSIVVTAGTIGRVTTGSIVATNGTIGGKGANAGATVGFPVLVAGMDSGGTAYTLLTDTNGHQQTDIQTGTITSVSNLAGGTIGVLTTGSIVVTNGTLVSSGTATGVGIVGNVNGGSIVVTTGTIAAHAITNVQNGTIGILTDGTISKVGTIPGVGIIGNLNTGSIVVTAGTIASSGTVTGVGVIGNINGGTLGILTNGSIVVTGGTIKNDGRTARNILTFGTTFGGTAAAYGTLVGSASIGSGTSLWVNDVSIVNNAGTLTASVGFGTALNGSNIIAKGNFGAQGGIQKSFPMPVNAGSTNTDLTCYISAAGTIDVCVSYFIST